MLSRQAEAAPGRKKEKTRHEHKVTDSKKPFPVGSSIHHRPLKTIQGHLAKGSQV
jgi:hypothetical protein